MPDIDPNPRTPDDDSFIQGKNWVTKKVTDVIFTVTPKCTEMTHLISKEMDRPLPFFTRFKMHLHYLACCYCKRYKINLHFIGRLLRVAHEHAQELSAAELSGEAKERMKRSLRDNL